MFDRQSKPHTGEEGRSMLLQAVSIPGSSSTKPRKLANCICASRKFAGDARVVLRWFAIFRTQVAERYTGYLYISASPYSRIAANEWCCQAQNQHSTSLTLFHWTREHLVCIERRERLTGAPCRPRVVPKANTRLRRRDVSVRVTTAVSTRTMFR